MKRSHRWVAAVLAAGLALAVIPATGAHASSEGRRNTAWAATAAAGYLAYRYAQKPSTGRAAPAVAAAGAAGYAWVNYNKKRKAERQQERAAWVNYGRRTAYSGARTRTAGYRASGRHRDKGRHCQR